MLFRWPWESQSFSPFVSLKPTDFVLDNNNDDDNKNNNNNNNNNNKQQQQQ